MRTIHLADVQAVLPSDRHQRSNFIAISTLIADIWLYLITFYGSLWIPSWYGKVFCAVLNAIAISRLFIVGHDACHCSLTDSKSLNTWIARRVMFEMLRSGGKLLVANFVPHKSIGYMESFMQWQLIYRSVAEVEAFANEIEPSQIASQRTFFDEHSNIVFLELVHD